LDPLLSTLVLILVALFGARLSFSTERVPPGYRLVLRTGTHFILFGFLLGPSAMGLLSETAIAQLSPLVGLALGWIGLLFGLQLDWSTLRLFPRSFPGVALGQAALTFVICAAVGLGITRIAGVSGPAAMLVVFGASATASVTTPAAIASVSGNFMARGKVRDLLAFIAALDGLVGITALHLTYVLLHGTVLFPEAESLSVLFWVVAGVALSVICAVVFLWLNRLRPSREELILYLLGMSALASGAALQLQISPLWVGMVAGAIISNLNPSWHRVFKAMERWEKPIYLILLLLAGAELRFPTVWIPALALGYILIRGFAKVVAAGLMVRLLPLPFAAPSGLGLGLQAQGGIAVAMVLSLSISVRGSGISLGGTAVADLLVSTVVLGVLISEVVSPALIARLLRRRGEIAPGVREALAEGDLPRARRAAREAK
jgi:hypothetical protein